MSHREQPLGWSTRALRALAPNVSGLPRMLAWDRERSGRGSVHVLGRAPVNAELRRKLLDFEQRTVLTLSEGLDHYRVHDPVNAYYRACGPRCVTLVAEEDGRVVATESLVVRRFRIPRRPPARFVYVTNVRVAPECRFGTVLARVHLAALRWSFARCWAAFSIVPPMTSSPPRSRSGRFGIPTLRLATRCARIEMTTDDASPADLADRCVSTERVVRRIHRILSRDLIAPIGGRPELRSSSPPVWIALPDASACCCLEDFRRTKRIFRPDGTEVMWRSLSFFAARDTDAALAICRVALAHAARLGPQGVKLMADSQLCHDIARRMTVRGPIIPMHVYASSVLHRLPNARWAFNVSEV